MGYSIYIGNAEVEIADLEDSYGRYEADFHVAEREEESAPHFPYDTMTGKTNGRHPSYTQWDAFAREVGLHSFFFDKENGLMRVHPGCFQITPEHLSQVRGARERWEASHPGAIPGWDFDPEWGFKGDVEDGVRGRDGMLARLLWLEWWMGWALENCERPAFCNT